jgi:hypothetical protein
VSEFSVWTIQLNRQAEDLAVSETELLTEKNSVERIHIAKLKLKGAYNQAEDRATSEAVRDMDLKEKEEK